MFLVYLAAFCSALSFLTGILAVGSGVHFQFNKIDLIRGRRDAWLYVWVTFSSMFALAHCASLLDYGLTHNWSYQTSDIGRWMAVHSGVGVLLTTAHLFIRGDLKQSSSESIYLWGTRCVR